MAALYIRMQQQRRRSSLGLNKSKIRTMEKVLQRFVSHNFLANNSLYSNLFSSEELSIDCGKDLLGMLFEGRKVGEREAYEFSYFHKRQKKLIMYDFLRQFLSSGGKSQLALLLNQEQLASQELEEYLGPTIWESFSKRVLVFHHSSQAQFLFNLQYISILRKQREFLKCAMLSDINAFESNDKGLTEKYYKKLPKDLLVVSFKKDFYEYRPFQKSSLAYISEQQDLRQMNQKLASYLTRKIECFSYHCALLVPLQYVYPSQCHTIEDSFKTVLLRAGQNSQFQQIVFTASPFQIDQIRQF